LVHSIAARDAILACILSLIAPVAVRAQDLPVVLIPHRAVYDLSLAQTRGDSQIAAVRGRILYDFSGNACEGYSLDFRQVSELYSGEDKVSTSDLRSSTWESADAKKFKFSSENYVDENLVGSVEGYAERGAKESDVKLSKPQRKSFTLGPEVVFPTEHMVRAITAALKGTNILDFPVYDGSENGDKVFDTLTVIGRKIAPGERKHDDAAAHEPQLAAVSRWPVTISYFGRDKTDSGEQAPDYAIAFELYENGISRALTLDYNDFIVSGQLTSLEIKTPKPCP
jgi:hypothetical protein